MSLVTETMARGVTLGTCFPPSAKCIDWPLATFFYLEKAPTDAQLEDTMRRIISLERLRSTVVKVGRDKYAWSVLEGMEKRIHEHVTRKEVRSAEELRAEMDALVNSNLEGKGTRPLWDITVLTLKKGVKWVPAPGGSETPPPVVCIRVSHAIGDGLSLVGVLPKLCDGVDGGAVQTLDFKRRALPSPTSIFTSSSSSSFSSVLSSFPPFKFLAQLFALVYYLYHCLVAMLAAFATPFGTHDTKTALCDTSKKIANSGVRRLVISPSFPLADLKEVRARFGCTVNDVVTACLSGAIQRYQKHFNDPMAEKRPRIRAAVPYAFPKRPKDCLTNSWTFVTLPLVTGPMDIKERLRKTQQVCNLMKTTPGAWATNVLNIISNKLLGFDFQSQTVYDFMSRHSLVFTNVPGPTAPVMMFGNKVREMGFGIGNLVNQFIVVSYAGNLGLSMVLDTDEIKDAHLIGKFFLEEINELRKKPHDDEK